MKHAFMYQGAYESNYPGLKPGMTTYVTTEGDIRPLPDWPENVDGVRAGYMERAAKKFFVVRLQYDAFDIVLPNPVHLDPARHTNHRRVSATPLIASDDEASALLDDVIRDNPDVQPELAMMINRINQVRRDARSRRES